MSTDSQHIEPEKGDPLEDNELARRLRRMHWPPAPQEVKDRVLDRILDEADDPRRSGQGEDAA